MSFKSKPLWKLILRLNSINCLVMMVPKKYLDGSESASVKIVFNHKGMKNSVWAEEKDELDALIRAASYLPPQIKEKL